MSHLSLCTRSHSSLASYEPSQSATTGRPQVTRAENSFVCDANRASAPFAPYNARLSNNTFTPRTQVIGGESLLPALALAGAGFLAGGPYGALIGGAVGLMGCAATVSDSDGDNTPTTTDASPTTDAAVEDRSTTSIAIHPPSKIINVDVPYTSRADSAEAGVNTAPDASADTNTPEVMPPDSAVVSDANACPIVSLDPLNGVDVVPNASEAIAGAPCLADALGVLVVDPNSRPVTYNFIRYEGHCATNSEGNPTSPPSTAAVSITPSVTTLPTAPGLNRQVVACDIPPSSAIYCYCAIPTPMPPACNGVIRPVCAEGQLITR